MGTDKSVKLGDQQAAALPIVISASKQGIRLTQSLEAVYFRTLKSALITNKAR